MQHGYQVESHLDIYDFKNFKIETLNISSQVLKGNPLKDSPHRKNPVLIPKESPPKNGFPVVLVLAGFSGNGPKYFGPKTFEKNGPEVLDECAIKGEAPLAIYVFVDAMTFWGGSQFINSEGTGQYEDYIIKEIVPAIKKYYSVQSKSKFWCVTGGSSGGYGALHLASKFPKTFGVCAAIAPDSFFEQSLLGDVLTAIPLIERVGGVAGVKNEMLEGRFLRRKDAFTALNAIGMGVCYAPKAKSHVEFPVDKMGLLKKSVWKKWKSNDPIVFLKKRKKKLQTLHKVYLDVGDRDQYHLQYGARQIRQIFKDMQVSLHYTEFKGNHWDISDRRPQVWAWLKKCWR